MSTKILSEQAKNWLKYGERGISSEAIFSKLTGIPILREGWITTHPADPDDFKRCEKLLRAVPAFRERLALMSLVSPIWKNMVDHWDEIVTLMESEIPSIFSGETLFGKAPKTYALMQTLQKVVEKEE